MAVSLTSGTCGCMYSTRTGTVLITVNAAAVYAAVLLSNRTMLVCHIISASHVVQQISTTTTNTTKYVGVFSTSSYVLKYFVLIVDVALRCPGAGLGGFAARASCHKQGDSVFTLCRRRIELPNMCTGNMGCSLSA